MNVLGFEGQVISTCGNSHGNLPLLLQRQNKKTHTTNKTNTEMPPKKHNSKNEFCVPAWDSWEINVLSTKVRTATYSTSYLCFDRVAYGRSCCLHTCASSGSILKTVSPKLCDYTRDTWDIRRQRLVYLQSALYFPQCLQATVST